MNFLFKNRASEPLCKTKQSQVMARQQKYMVYIALYKNSMEQFFLWDLPPHKAQI